MIAFLKQPLPEQWFTLLNCARACLDPCIHHAQASKPHQHYPGGWHPKIRHRWSLFRKIECRTVMTAADMAQLGNNSQSEPCNSFRLNTEIVRNFLIGQAKIGHNGDRRCRIWTQNRARFNQAGRVASFGFASTHHGDFRRFASARPSRRPRSSDPTRTADCLHPCRHAVALR